MEEIVKAVIDNGLGVGSFIVLIWFMNKIMDKFSNTLNKINDTQVQMQINMVELKNELEKMRKGN